VEEQGDLRPSKTNSSSIAGAVVTPEALAATRQAWVRLIGFERKHPLSVWDTDAAASPFAKTMPSRSYRLKSWTQESPLGVWCPHFRSTPAAASDADHRPSIVVAPPPNSGHAASTASALPPDVTTAPHGHRGDQLAFSQDCHPSADAQTASTDTAVTDRSTLDISPSRRTPSAAKEIYNLAAAIRDTADACFRSAHLASLRGIRPTSGAKARHASEAPMSKDTWRTWRSWRFVLSTKRFICFRTQALACGGARLTRSTSDVRHFDAPLPALLGPEFTVAIAALAPGAGDQALYCFSCRTLAQWSAQIGTRCGK
jgi:hypothetical protein